MNHSMTFELRRVDPAAYGPFLSNRFPTGYGWASCSCGWAFGTPAEPEGSDGVCAAFKGHERQAARDLGLPMGDS